MKYYVFEIQKMPDNAYSHIVHEANDRNAAESVYHHVLASAAVSNLPEHSAVMFTGDGFPIMHQSYTHDAVPQPEEVTEEVPEETPVE